MLHGEEQEDADDHLGAVSGDRRKIIRAVEGCQRR